MIRLHVAGALAPAAPIVLDPAQSHYLFTVMRQKSGAVVLAFNGRDGEWACVLAAEKRAAVLTPARMTRAQPPPARLQLLCALVKRGRLETIVEKSAELGVGRVRLLRTQRTNYDRPNLERLQAIATEAAEQTGRLDVPEIAAPESLRAALEDREAPRPLVFCDEAGDDPQEVWGGPAGRAPPALERLLASGPDEAGAGAGVLIGPEGGFDPEERAWLRSRDGVIPVSLGPRILRADTAAIAALTLVQAARGDWRGPPAPGELS